MPESAIPPSPSSSHRYVSPTVEDVEDEDNSVFCTPTNPYGIYRDVDNSESHSHTSIGPFNNPSQFRIYDWFYNTSITKSKEDLDDLINVLSSNIAQKKLDTYEHPSGIFSNDNGWVESSVKISLPKLKVKHTSEDAAPKFAVHAAQDTHFTEQYHWMPHQQYWLPRSLHHGLAQGKPRALRIVTDIFNSNAMLDEHEKIREQPHNPADGDDIEYAIFSMLLWSDNTHLTQFGSASLWPIYLYLGNLSKYIRGMLTEFTAHHLAYIPGLPDTLQDFYTDVYGVPPSKDVLTFCKRELMRQIWLLLMDTEFMGAYENGMLVTCGDGVVCRLFPHIFSYSADYSGKILLTALKPQLIHPCPRCLVTDAHLCDAGTPEDAERRAEKRIDSPHLRWRIARARKLIFKKGCLVKSKSSAFSTRLACHGINFYNLFVPDLMHKFELGVWKGTFTHLRLLAAQGEAVVQEFDQRQFWKNVSARKQLAARDYEDSLIVMLPVFEGLMPVHDDQTVAKMLFELANWHALAKLRLHTELTVDIFRMATGHMTASMRHFAATMCEEWETHKLPKEVDARVHREEKQHKETNCKRKVTYFNVLNTYKFHSLPDYPDSIKATGTLDNGNTQVGELEHRHVKRFYARTNKIGFSMQIARHQHHTALMRALHQSDDYVPWREHLRQDHLARLARNLPRCNDPSAQAVPEADNRPDSPLPPTDPLTHYAISNTSRLSLQLRNWDFIPLLRVHLLTRMLYLSTCVNNDDTFSDKQLDGIELQNDRIYRHKILRLNYTTYDMRCDQDIIKPGCHPDIMLLSSEIDSKQGPFVYARVLDIFHANWTHEWHRIDFLWVRWYSICNGNTDLFQSRSLPRLRFVEAHNPSVAPFGFVNPANILRSSFILPAFHYGTTNGLLDHSKLARYYNLYYICIFVDRDMYMQYLGGGEDTVMSERAALQDRPLHGYSTPAPGSSDDKDGPTSDPDNMGVDHGSCNSSSPTPSTSLSPDQTRYRVACWHGHGIDNSEGLIDEDAGEGEGEGEVTDEDVDNEDGLEPCNDEMVDPVEESIDGDAFEVGEDEGDKYKVDPDDCNEPEDDTKFAEAGWAKGRGSDEEFRG
ncbi:hypothetical protein BC628DRAFT_1411049 [Trametes gibbosa]|nr:hypothetical protein BC628DRAFT_1411049 [Trametes gibbosa]